MKYSLFLIVLGIYVQSISQDTYDRSYLNSRNVLERISTISPLSNVIPGVPLPVPSIRGNSFLNENFALTTFDLSTKVIASTHYANYDMFRDEFYLITKKGYNVLRGSEVNAFLWQDSLSNKIHRYIHAKLILPPGESTPKGFYEVLSEGSIILLKKIEINVLNPDYNIAMNVGRQDYQMVKKEELFTFVNNSLVELPNANQLTSVFGDKEEIIQEFIKINLLNRKDERHIVEIFHYYNHYSSYK